MAKRISFEELQAQMFDLYLAHDLAEALEAAESTSRLYPDRSTKTAYWKACILSLMGRPEEAVSALAQGLANGAWWAPAMLSQDPDLEAARTLPQMAEILADSDRRWRAAQAQATLSVVADVCQGRVLLGRPGRRRGRSRYSSGQPARLASIRRRQGGTCRRVARGKTRDHYVSGGAHARVHRSSPRCSQYRGIRRFNQVRGGARCERVHYHRRARSLPRRSSGSSALSGQQRSPLPHGGGGGNAAYLP